jgi:hypothetical protein
VVQREPRLLKSVLISVSGGALGILVGYLTTAFLKATLAALPLNLTILPVLIPAEASIASASTRRTCSPRNCRSANIALPTRLNSTSSCVR